MAQLSLSLSFSHWTPRLKTKKIVPTTRCKHYTRANRLPRNIVRTKQNSSTKYIRQFVYIFRTPRQKRRTVLRNSSTQSMNHLFSKFSKSNTFVLSKTSKYPLSREDRDREEGRWKKDEGNFLVRGIKKSEVSVCRQPLFL